MANDLIISDDEILQDGGMQVLSEADRRDLESLEKALHECYPAVTQDGFDFNKIRGNLEGKTAKTIILALTCHGWSIAKISDHLEIKPKVVRNYLADAVREAAPIQDIEVARQLELHKCDVLEEAAWKSFQRSCEDAEVVTTSETKDGTFETRTVKGQSGDHTMLKTLLETSRHRAALLGLNKPTQVKIDKTVKNVKLQLVEVRNRQELPQTQ